MNKQVITNMFLTKEALEQHVRELREKKAKEYGMTLEQWDTAVLTGQVVMPVSGSGQPPNNPGFGGKVPPII
jgi:hypothetical protein